MGVLRCCSEVLQSLIAFQSRSGLCWMEPGRSSQPMLLLVGKPAAAGRCIRAALDARGSLYNCSGRGARAGWSMPEGRMGGGYLAVEGAPPICMSRGTGTLSMCEKGRGRSRDASAL